METLMEDLLLVALDEESGKIRSSDKIGYALGGAVLMELAVAGCVTVDDGKVAAADCSPPADPLVREGYDLVRSSDKQRKAKDWVGRLAKKLDLKKRVPERLAEQGVVSDESGGVLGALGRRRYELRDGGADDPRGRVQAILLDGAQPSERDALLLSLLNAVDLVKKLVPRDRRKEAKAIATSAADHDAIGAAVKKAVREIEAAAAAAAAAGAAAAGAGS